MDIAALRTTYRRAALDEHDVKQDPIAQFDAWLHEAIAADAREPTAMTLATVDADGRPSARVVLLKGLDVAAVVPGASGRGFVWFTNYASRKGRALAADPRAALCFFWAELERQVRVEGLVERTGDDESDRYFASRPLASRIGAVASPQSDVIGSRAVLEAAESALRDSLPRDDESALRRPPHWGGYRLVPTSIEFWQGRPSRLHDRLVFRGGDGAWTLARLAP